jgi:4-hydroxy-tetrahydrodipicolinate reductase
MKILIVGSGKLATAILESNISIDGAEMLKWDAQTKKLSEKTVLVHAGSGRELKECFDFCERTSSVFIELSTGLETEKMNPAFPLVICPNTSVLLLKTLHMLKAYGKSYHGYDISITESHQASKTTEPGTAYAFADSLNVPHNKIVSVREPEMQQHKIGIPPEFINKHAYHKIVIKDGTDEITLETKVLGHQSYAQGVKAIVDAVIKHPLAKKRYSVLDLIENNLI